MHAKKDGRLVEIRLKDSCWRSEVWPVETCVTVLGHEMKPAYPEIDSDSGGKTGADLVHEFEGFDFSSVCIGAGSVNVGIGINGTEDDAGIDEWSNRRLREWPFHHKRKVPSVDRCYGANQEVGTRRGIVQPAVEGIDFKQKPGGNRDLSCQANLHWPSTETVCDERIGAVQLKHIGARITELQPERLGVAWKGKSEKEKKGRTEFFKSN